MQTGAIVSEDPAMNTMSKKFSKIGVMVGLLVVIVAATIPAGAAVDTAVLVPTPAPGSSSYLRSLSCLTATSCIAVGDTWDASSTQSLVESWDGVAWTVVASPSVPNSESSLRGVSCVDSSFCFAVGNSGPWNDQHSLTEIWNGTSWTIVPSPDGMNHSRFNSVSCVSTSFCVAVGDDAANTSTLVEIWDGNAWSISSTPSAGTLTSVACVSATFCMAVGLASGGNREATAFEWDGLQWAATVIPNGGTGSGAASISCLSPVFCVLAGSENRFPYEPLAGFWDGSTWTLDTSFVVDPGAGLGINSIDCVTEQSCIVTGSRYLANGLQETLMLGWSGTSWNEIASPAESVTDYSESYSVSCATEWFCMSVGYYEPIRPDSTRPDVTLAIEVTGTEPPTTTTTTPPTTATITGTDLVVPVFTG